MFFELQLPLCCSAGLLSLLLLVPVALCAHVLLLFALHSLELLWTHQTNDLQPCRCVYTEVSPPVHWDTFQRNDTSLKHELPDSALAGIMDE